ncbi:hypothetical protein [Paracoccus sp. S1E-3]|uniref:hypothetical protein n=1 Tax=Paracoccus sp. S1E-3 TaxID=2756130 RepID=UPI0015EF8FEF|nr:hypothetical protein [Paracoccus sp. S1E-3]MBA4492087.1 hypothetical protein [Paracoccus sp. S1E-3]
MSQYDDAPLDMPQSRRPPEAQAAPRTRGHSKLVLWGGIGLAAGVSLLAARTLAEALAGDAEDRPRPKGGRRGSLAPRFADMDEDDRRALRARARAEVLDFEERAADLREAALRERREKERAARARHRKRARRSMMSDIGSSAVKLATGITTLIAAANAAMDGLQQVSGRTGGIMQDLSDTADKLRGFFDGGRPAPATPPAPPAQQATADAAPAPEPGRDRTHRL